MSSNYYIKAYCTKPDQQQPEIRRFEIDISPEKDVYQELQTKIASLQSDNQLKTFTLQYVDEDNERITFSSNDELRSAIAFNKDANTLKVFVTFNQPIPQQQQQQQQQKEEADANNKDCHVGVECDGCKGPIIGFRYKCFVCPNYDLCEKCSAAGIHSEHNMIKITKPGNFQHFDDHYRRHFQNHHHHHQHHRHSPRTPPPFFPSQEFLQQVQTQIPQWLPNRENTAHIRAHMQQHFDSLKNNTQTHMHNSKQYLENVGQYLQQALSPFGINCDYHVDERNSTTNQQKQQEEQTSTTNQQQEEEEQTSTTETIPTPEPSAVPKHPDLTNVNNNQEQATASSSTTEHEESTPIKNPTEQAIDDCIERMKAMGFTDINGALRELVRSKQGEINAVLDAINPRHLQE